MSIINHILPVCAGWANPSYRRFSAWLNVYERRIQNLGFAKKTLQHKRMMLSKVHSMLGSRPIGSVTPFDIQSFLDYYINQGKTRSACIAHFLLKDIFREAEFNGWVNKNPIAPVLFPDDKVKRDRLSLSEWQRICKTACKSEQVSGVISVQI